MEFIKMIPRQWIALEFRIFLAEFLGTLVLVSFVCGSLAQYFLSSGATGSGITHAICGGLAPTFGIYIAGGVSGGHLNPAVTFTHCLLGRTRWRLYPIYVTAQYLGGFVGAALVYGMYIDAFNNHPDGRTMETAQIFGTYPAEWLGTGNALFDQIYCTALHLMIVFAITDKQNMLVPKELTPLAVGSTVVAMGLTFGYNAQAPLNPARDLSPRVLSWMVGWPDDVIQHRDYNWFWIPIVGSHIGAVCGSILYLLLVEIHEDPYMKTIKEPQDTTDR